MHSQTYYHTKLEEEANRKNDTVPLQVNCTGKVAHRDHFYNKSTRRDFYYIYVLQGKMVLREDVLLPGDVIVFEPGYQYQYQSDGETSYLWVHYTGYEACALTLSASLKPNVKQHIGIHKEIADCFKKLFREFMINDQASEQMSVCILREILTLTGRYVGADEKRCVPLLAIEHIHRNFQENIDIEALAQMEHMSCTAFRMVFKEHTGISPNEYIITQRISAACRLLIQTDKSVSAVAADVGYHDQYYFSRIFRKKVGIPPLKYRNEKRKSEIS